MPREPRALALAVLVVLALATPIRSMAQSLAGSAEATPDAAPAAPAYRESALRRMEIVAFVSLPFTAIHSYLIVRSVRMIQDGTIAAGVSGNDWTYVGIGAASLSVGIALYDWSRLRGKDRNEPLLPEIPTEGAATEPMSRTGDFQHPMLSASVRF